MADQQPARAVKSRGRPKKTQPADRVHVITLRLPEEMLRRLDAHTARLQAVHPYQRLSRAEVIRLLLDHGLGTEEGETGSQSHLS